ncbi:MAG: T9SS type A sorting domain-containing protein [Bacteroidetes bacterium]|nr:T9SS type A sorting domain-containing protein [Bacteroidota bacterium]
MQNKKFTTILIQVCLLFVSLPSAAQPSIAPDWVNNIGLDNGADEVRSMAVDGSGNVYVTGSFQGLAVDFDPSGSTYNLASVGGSVNSDVFLAKYNSSGSFVWAFSIGGTSADASYGVAVAGDYVYLTGVINGTSAIDMDPSSNTNTLTGAGSTDAFVAKYTASLTPSSTSFYQWAFAIGGTGADAAYQVLVSGTDIYFCGSVYGSTAIDMDPSTNTNNITGSGNNNDGFIAKYDGNFSPSSTSFYTWAFLYGRSTTSDIVYSITIQSNHIYMAGQLSSSFASDMDPSVNTFTLGANGAASDIVVAKYDASLTPSNTSFFVWAFRVGGTTADVAYKITNNGDNIYLTGAINGTTAIDMDPSTNTNSITGAGSTDIFVAKYDGSLTPSNTSFYQWAFRAGSTGGDIGYDLFLNGTDIYLAGLINGTTAIDMDPSTNTNNITGLGSNEGFYAKYDGSLASSNTSFYQWAFPIGGTANDVAYTAALASTHVYIGGNILSTTVDMDPSGSTANLGSPSGTTDCFIGKYSTAGAYSNAFAIGATGGSDAGSSIVVDGSGNVYAAGTFTGSNVDFDPSGSTSYLSSNGNSDAYIVKYNSSGALVWAFSLGGSGADNIKTIKVSGTTVYIIGTINGTSAIDFDPSSNTNNITGAGNDDIFVAKYDGSLDPTNTSFYKWAFNIGNPEREEQGNITINGTDLYLTGATRSTSSLDLDPSTNTNSVITATSTFYLFMAKYDLNFAPSSTSFFKWGFNTDLDNTQSISTLNISGTDIILTSNKVSESSIVDIDPSANTYTITGRGMTMIKYDGTTTPSNTSFFQWGWCLGDLQMSNFPTSVYDAVLDGTNLFIAGMAGEGTDIDPSSNVNTFPGLCGFTDILVAKYDISLNPSSTSFFQWAFTLSSTSDCTFGSQERAVGLVIFDDDLYVVGSIDDTPVDLDPSTNTNSVSPTSAGQAFVAVYKKNLIPTNTFFHQWGFIPTGGGGSGVDIEVDAIGDLYVTGSFYSENVDFDPTAGSLAHSACLTGATTTNSFVGKYASGIPLPIQLVSFNAEPENNTHVNVWWETASEVNNEYFVVERSQDAKKFEPILWINAKGNSYTKINYSIVDSFPFQGVSYYRLKQIDFDGEYSYSNLVAVMLKNESINIFPNPANDQIMILVNDEYFSNGYEISIVDAMGKKHFVGSSTQEKYELDIGELFLPCGVYSIKLQSAKSSTSQKVVLVR